MEHLETKRNVERERRKVEDIKFLSPPCAHALARAGSARYGHGHEHRTLLARTFSLHIGVEDIVIHISYRPFTHDITVNHTRKRHSNERFWLQDPKAPQFVRLVSCIKKTSVKMMLNKNCTHANVGDKTSGEEMVTYGHDRMRGVVLSLGRAGDDPDEARRRTNCALKMRTNPR